MTGDQLHNEASEDLESVVANGDLLDLLRTEPEFSVDEYGDLDIILEKLKNGLAEFVSGFISDEVFLELSNVAIFTDEEQFGDLGSTASFVNLHDKTGELTLCVGLGSTAFRKILKKLLGGSKDEAAAMSTRALTGGETKLFHRFSHRLCQAYSGILELKFGEQHAVETDFKLLNKLAKETELILLNYEVSFTDAKFILSVLTTLDQLEPKYNGYSSSGSDTGVGPAIGSWSKKLADRVDELEIPVFAHLAEKTMNLVDVAKIESGMRLDIEFGMNNVCVTDSEHNSLFAADMEIHESEVVFSITGSPMNSRGKN